MSIIIKGVGSYIPEKRISNNDFFHHEFYAEDGELIPHPNEIIINKFKEITGIEERRYLDDNMLTSDMAGIASEKAIADAGIEKEEIDLIIFAHNFGDVGNNHIQSDLIPSLATRVKNYLKISNPDCVAFDIIYGCPGWIQGVIIARQYILAGDAKNVLVIGAEALSRVIDPYDRDSMIYSDGAGATIISYADDKDKGIITVASQTYTLDESFYLYFGTSYKKSFSEGRRYLKMHGRKIYEFALKNVPLAMKSCLDKSGKSIDDVKKIFIHQANEKMDDAIISRFYKLYGKKQVPPHLVPMSIHELGNSSVATVPTLLDLVKRKQIKDHSLEEGDLIILASVGAGMSINAICYII